MSRIYLDGPWDALRAQESTIVERLEDLEEALPGGDEILIARRRTELADAIIGALQEAYQHGRGEW